MISLKQVLQTHTERRGGCEAKAGKDTEIESGNLNASGFNSSELVTLDPAAIQITATFDIASVTNEGDILSNGFFLGIVTGADATATNGDGFGPVHYSKFCGLLLHSALDTMKHLSFGDCIHGIISRRRD